jgi:hypothetical protein
LTLTGLGMVECVRVIDGVDDQQELVGHTLAKGRRDSLAAIHPSKLHWLPSTVPSAASTKPSNFTLQCIGRTPSPQALQKLFSDLRKLRTRLLANGQIVPRLRRHLRILLD